MTVSKSIFKRPARILLLSVVILSVSACSWPGTVARGVTGLFIFNKPEPEKVEALSVEDKRATFEEEFARSSGTLPELPEPGSLENVPLEEPKALNLEPIKTNGSVGGSSSSTPTSIIPTGDIASDKLTRLEQSVQALDENLDILRPAYARIEALEVRMVQLMQRLDLLVRSQNSFTGEYGTAQRSSPAPVREQRAAPRPASASIIGQRVGEHKDKTRLVLELEGNTAYTYDIDQSENLLLITLPDAVWDRRSGRSEGRYKDRLFKSYTAQPLENGGIQLIIQLAHKSRIVKADKIPPSNGKPTRIYFDLRSGAIHRI